MSLPRFFCKELAPGAVALDAAESRHALGSLRLRPGDEALLFDGRGRVAHGVLKPNKHAPAERASRRGGQASAEFSVERVLCEPPPTRTLTIIAAACKGPRLTWMIEKLTELGTTRIVIANFERSVVRTERAHAEKLGRTALEAAKQSQRAWLPEITCGSTLENAVSGEGRGGLLVAHPAEEAAALAPRLLAHEYITGHVIAVIGPEGGLTDDEIEMLRSRSGELVRLAPTILRVETAALSVAANWAAHEA